MSAKEAAPHYRVLAEVWGTVKGSLAPVAWIGGLSEQQNQSLRLGLDTRWIALAGAEAPFELRNVRVEIQTISSRSRRCTGCR